MSDRVPTIVITGGTKGLGRATAELFAEQGFDVFVCSRTAADLEAMQLAWAEKFPQRKLFTEVVDLAEKEAVLRFGQRVRKRWSRIDVLVNNAGIFLPGSISGEADGALEHMMQINLYSAYYLTRELLPLMVPHKKGHIFNMCSIASLFAYPNSSAYTITKFALLGFSKVLREELKTEGVKVTALLPGATWSDSWKGADFPEDRLMAADDIAKTIWGAYTLSDSAVVEELIIRPQLGDL
ncbi:MAG: SDR family oxidoreductase [Bacteroidetes bacterium]|nr:MAG: SDR family oxidoreductase [Bacteroidota bacterium]